MIAVGVSIQPMTGMDLTRKLYAVTLHDVMAERLANPDGLARGLHRLGIREASS